MNVHSATLMQRFVDEQPAYMPATEIRLDNDRGRSLNFSRFLKTSILEKQPQPQL
jgi:hypothetical protein